MNFSNFMVKVVSPSTATRPNGLVARQQIKRELALSDTVVVDLQDVVLTPSFADEFLGLLLVELGESDFRRRIKIVNVGATSRPLLRQVLSQRASSGPIDVQAHDALHSRQLIPHH
ncbi:DUF4325 domain-containing protein [Stenotrophomonas maltophilia]|nr:DUF4325 domain-containing protein [Stenotrophomonas maltophilia]